MSAFPNKDSKTLLLTLLKVMGGYKVEVSFSGGGDSGSIDDVNLLDSNGESIDLQGAEFEWQRETSFHDGNEWRKSMKTEVMPVFEILRGITEDALNETDLDWYNNEGGQGQLTIDLAQDPPKIDLLVEINYTHTESHNFDLNEEDEEEENERTA